MNFQKKIQPEKPRIKFNKLMITFLLVIILMLIGSIGTSIYFYRKVNLNPQEEAINDLARTIELVGKHLVLPTNESPTMATVSDPEKLRDQPFFANAKKGDKVLIYSESRKAILYNPESDKIVELSPINANIGAPTGN